MLNRQTAEVTTRRLGKEGGLRLGIPSGSR